MKKIFFIIVLCSFFHNISQAKWIYATTSAETKIRHYVESSSIIKDGEVTYIWILSDYVKRGKYNEMSIKAYVPVKCKLKQFQVLQLIYYSENMGKGNLIERIDNPPSNTKWIGASPGSAWAQIIRKACAK